MSSRRSGKAFIDHKDELVFIDFDRDRKPTSSRWWRPAGLSGMILAEDL